MFSLTDFVVSNCEITAVGLGQMVVVVVELDFCGLVVVAQRPLDLSFADLDMVRYVHVSLVKKGVTYNQPFEHWHIAKRERPKGRLYSCKRSLPPEDCLACQG